MSCVLLFLPLEYFTHYLEWGATEMYRVFEGVHGTEIGSPLKIIVKPVVQWFESVLAGIWGDNKTALAISILVLALIFLFISLKYLVTIMKSLLIGRIENLNERLPLPDDGARADAGPGPDGRSSRAARSPRRWPFP